MGGLDCKIGANDAQTCLPSDDELVGRLQKKLGKTAEEVRQILQGRRNGGTRQNVVAQCGSIARQATIDKIHRHDVLRNAERSAFLAAIGRTDSQIRAIELPPDLGQRIHQNRLLQLARESAATTVQHFARFDDERRYGSLVAVLLSCAIRIAFHSLWLGTVTTI